MCNVARSSGFTSPLMHNNSLHQKIIIIPFKLNENRSQLDSTSGFTYRVLSLVITFETRCTKNQNQLGKESYSEFQASTYVYTYIMQPSNMCYLSGQRFQGALYNCRYAPFLGPRSLQATVLVQFPSICLPVFQCCQCHCRFDTIPYTFRAQGLLFVTSPPKCERAVPSNKISLIVRKVSIQDKDTVRTPTRRWSWS